MSFFCKFKGPVSHIVHSSHMSWSWWCLVSYLRWYVCWKTRLDLNTICVNMSAWYTHDIYSASFNSSSHFFSVDPRFGARIDAAIAIAFSDQLQPVRTGSNRSTPATIGKCKWPWTALSSHERKHAYLDGQIEAMAATEFVKHAPASPVDGGEFSDNLYSCNRASRTSRLHQ